MKNIIKSMLCIIVLSVLLAAPQSVSAKTGKGISIEKTFAKGTRDEISRKVYDKNQDGYLSKNEIKKIKELKLYSYLNANIENKLNLKGISKLKYLEEIYFDAFGRIYNLKEISKLRNLTDVEIRAKLKKKRVLDFRRCKNIRTLKLWLPYKKGIVKVKKNNKIKYLDFTGIRNSITVVNMCNKAEKIYIKGNVENKKLNIIDKKYLKNVYLYNLKTDKEINIQKCPKLKNLIMEYVQCRGLDIKNTEKLEKLKTLFLKVEDCCIEEASVMTLVDIRGGSINQLKINNLKKLKTLSLVGIKLSEISMVALDSLRKVDMSDIKKLKEIEFRNLNRLKEIDMSNMKNLKTLTIENTPRLWSVTCMHGMLSELNIFGKNSIGKMRLFDNKLTKFEYSNLPYIYYLDIGDNRIGGKFDMSLYPDLESFYCENNLLEEIYCGEKDRDFYVINCKNNKIKLIHAGENAYVFVSGMNCKNNPGIVIKVDVEDYIRN